MTPTRIHRSELTVPATSERMIDKARSARADFVMLDLEDGVAPNDKVEARARAIAALRDRSSWSAPSLSLRINALDTEWCYRDVVDVAEAVGGSLTTVTVPKVSSASDVHFVATLLGQVEQVAGLDVPIGISALIETARGMSRVHEIAASCPGRLESLVFGVADYAASMQSSTTAIGGADPWHAVLTGSPADPGRELHWGDQWHHALSQVAIACRANGLRPIDGPFGDIADADAYVAAARRAAVLGYEGKWAIHPAQIALANAAFTPDDEVVDRAQRIISAMNEAEAARSGTATLDGAMIDAASVRIAERVLEKTSQIDRIVSDG